MPPVASPSAPNRSANWPALKTCTGCPRSTSAVTRSPRRVWPMKAATDVEAASIARTPDGTCSMYTPGCLYMQAPPVQTSGSSFRCPEQLIDPGAQFLEDPIEVGEPPDPTGSDLFAAKVRSGRPNPRCRRLHPDAKHKGRPFLRGVGQARRVASREGLPTAVIVTQAHIPERTRSWSVLCMHLPRTPEEGRPAGHPTDGNNTGARSSGGSATLAGRPRPIGGTVPIASQMRHRSLSAGSKRPPRRAHVFRVNAALGRARMPRLGWAMAGKTGQLSWLRSVV